MNFIEVSKKIQLTKEATQEDIKQALLNRLRRAFKIDSLKEQDARFHFEGTTGGIKSLIRDANLKIDVSIIKNQETVRIIVEGYSSAARSLMALYSGLFFFLLLLGLAPGSIETSGDKSGAADALVFLLFGVFIFYDINRKITAPIEQLQSILNSLDTEFG